MNDETEARTIGLTDLKRKTKLHKLNGGEEQIELIGLTANDYFGILSRFPNVAVLAVGSRGNLFDALVQTPGAIAAWVAAACGKPGDPEAEKIAMESLTAEEATAIVEASLPLTFSNGYGPFFDRLDKILSRLYPPSRGKDPGTTSPEPSSPAEDQPIQGFGS